MGDEWGSESSPFEALAVSAGVSFCGGKGGGSYRLSALGHAYPEQGGNSPNSCQPQDEIWGVWTCLDLTLASDCLLQSHSFPASQLAKGKKT